MALLSVQTVVRGGLTPSYDAADPAGDTFANDGNTMLHARNAGTAARQVTVRSQVANPPPGTSPADVVVTVPAGGEVMVGPFPPSAFANQSGLAEVAYDDAADVTVAAIGLGPTIQK
jgi:hypothetical protein